MNFALCIAGLLMAGYLWQGELLARRSRRPVATGTVFLLDPATQAHGRATVQFTRFDTRKPAVDLHLAGPFTITLEPTATGDTRIILTAIITGTTLPAEDPS